MSDELMLSLDTDARPPLMRVIVVFAYMQKEVAVREHAYPSRGLENI